MSSLVINNNINVNNNNNKKCNVKRIQDIFITIILCVINVLNYMDRFSIAGILDEIQLEFKMNESQSGFLQTAFILSYIVMAPVFGYLGDRISRKSIMLYGILLWSLSTVIGSFMPTYTLFLLCRCFVGVGEASFSTIAPTIISDIFINNKRSIILGLFYLAIPVGCGLGYITGSKITKIFNNWRYSLRLTPIITGIAILLVFFFMKEPSRGENELYDEQEEEEEEEKRVACPNLKYLFNNKSYILSTLGFVCATFVAGALAWWGPLFFKLSIQIQATPESNIDNQVDFIFGCVAVIAGIMGVLLGSSLSQIFRKKFSSSFIADPIICGTGLFLSVPLLGVSIYLAETNIILSFVACFFGQLFLNMNWAIVCDILMYLIVPTKRSFAAALQIFFSHAFGDAGSPYLVGFLADSFFTTVKNNNNSDFSNYRVRGKFSSIQNALYYCIAVNILGSIFFYANAFFIDEDSKKKKKYSESN